jgi:hypothetical protein
MRAAPFPLRREPPTRPPLTRGAGREPARAPRTAAAGPFLGSAPSGAADRCDGTLPALRRWRWGTSSGAPAAGSGCPRAGSASCGRGGPDGGGGHVVAPAVGARSALLFQDSAPHDRFCDCDAPGFLITVINANDRISRVKPVKHRSNLYQPGSSPRKPRQ